MKAAILNQPGKLEIREVRTPDCLSGGVLVKVKACGICSSDAKMVTSGHRALNYPRILGHEIAGIISESRNRQFKPGDRVQVAPGLRCGECLACRRGLDNQCEHREILGFSYDGGFAQYISIPLSGPIIGALTLLPKNVSFEEIYDLFAIRVVFDPKPGIPEKTQCWDIYSNITDIYPPKPDRIRDWVSTPKANGYEALHTTVMGPNGKWMEVQIRSRRMDEIAERGFAAHWKYKTAGAQDTELDKWIKSIRKMLEQPNSDAMEFLDEFKLNLFSSEIMVFTPKGHIITLPTGATALDLAYEIHSEIGNKAIGAKVNHKLLPLNAKLASGDQVEILTAEGRKPSIEWNDYATTVKAKSAIKAALKAERRDRIEIGKKMLEEQLKKLNLSPGGRVFKKILPAYESTNKDQLYSKIGTGMVSLDNLKDILSKNTKNKWVRVWDLSLGRPAVNPQSVEEDAYDEKGRLLLRENIDDKQTYELAECCNPIPGDEVIGERRNDGMISVHRTDCSDAIKIMSSQGDKLVTVSWTQHKVFSYLARIHLSGWDRFGVYNSITSTIAQEFNISIRTINLHGHDGIFDGTIDLYVHNTNDLNNLIMNLVKLKGVESVHRVEIKDQ